MEMMGIGVILPARRSMALALTRKGLPARTIRCNGEHLVLNGIVSRHVMSAKSVT